MIISKKEFLDELSLRGISVGFRKKKLPLIIESYINGMNVEDVAKKPELQLKRGVVDNIFSRLREIYDVDSKLYARNVLINTYQTLLKKYNSGVKLTLSDQACSKINEPKNDQKPCHMCYKNFYVFLLENQRWAISRGERGIGHLGISGHTNIDSEYNSDILAMNFQLLTSSDFLGEFTHRIHTTTNLENSLIVAMRGGSLDFGLTGKIPEAIKETTSSKMNDFVVDHDKRGRPLYEAGIVLFLANSIEDVLKAS